MEYFELVLVLCIICFGPPLSIFYFIGINNYHSRNENKRSLVDIIFKTFFKGVICFFFCLIYFASYLDLIGTFEYADYYIQIYTDRNYTPFSSEHRLSLNVFGSLYIISAILLLSKITRGFKLPPLASSLCIIFIFIGTALNIAIILQLKAHSRNEFFEFANFFCVVNIIVSIYIMLKIIREESNKAINRCYKNKFLNLLNRFIGRHYFILAFILLIPVFAIVTIILQLFGQAQDSIIKVFTETATWTFSKCEHPPYLEIPKEGTHYLCTVAACGHSKIVRPLHFGIRNNNTIIVNRQLQIANAYEEMIKNYLPSFHRIIRSIYDKYGYPISKKITNAYASDIVYILMKPLEYFFLINLYLFVEKPEELIKKQYQI